MLPVHTADNVATAAGELNRKASSHLLRLLASMMKEWL